jgi:hypothetical protein
LAQNAVKPAIFDTNGAPAPAAAVLVKGKSLEFTAKAAQADGGVFAPIAWTTEPAGVVSVETSGDGKVRITALRDWFDESPGREPSARVTACAGTACTAIAVTCLPDVGGSWPTRLLETFFNATEDRNLVFVQDGRIIRFDPEPAGQPDPERITTLRIEGSMLRLVKRGNVLTRFDGELTNRGEGKGNWASKWGFSGTWTAHKIR